MISMSITKEERRHNIIQTIRNAMDSLDHLEDYTQDEADNFIDSTYDAIGVLVQNAYYMGILKFSDLRNMNMCDGILPTMWA